MDIKRGCSQCGREFEAPERIGGFSHCENHAGLFPVSESPATYKAVIVWPDGHKTVPACRCSSAHEARERARAWIKRNLDNPDTPFEVLPEMVESHNGAEFYYGSSRYSGD